MYSPILAVILFQLPHLTSQVSCFHNEKFREVSNTTVTSLTCSHTDFCLSLIIAPASSTEIVKHLRSCGIENCASNEVVNGHSSIKLVNFISLLKPSLKADVETDVYKLGYSNETILNAYCCKGDFCNSPTWYPPSNSEYKNE